MTCSINPSPLYIGTRAFRALQAKSRLEFKKAVEAAGVHSPLAATPSPSAVNTPQSTDLSRDPVSTSPSPVSAFHLSPVSDESDIPDVPDYSHVSWRAFSEETIGDLASNRIAVDFETPALEHLTGCLQTLTLQQAAIHRALLEYSRRE